MQSLFRPARTVRNLARRQKYVKFNCTNDELVEGGSELGEIGFLNVRFEVRKALPFFIDHEPARILVAGRRGLFREELAISGAWPSSSSATARSF